MEKHDFLQALPRATLSQLVQAYGLDVDEQPTKDSLVEALATAQTVDARELLETMSGVALKAIALQFSLSKGPWHKTELIDAILAAKAPEPLGLSAVTTARELAAVLGETEFEPLKGIKKIIKVIGITRTKEFAAQAIQADSAGGMWYERDGDRKRRTLGGCFFWLVRDGITNTERHRAIVYLRPKKHDAQSMPPMQWEQRGEFFDEATKQDAHPAEAFVVKITIVGRPNKVLQPPDTSAVIALLECTKPPKNLPKGLPQPKCKTQYAIFISYKQWRKVEPLLKDPSDALIIEGFPLVDAAFNGISVMANSVTTRKVKQKQAEALRAKSQS